VSNIAGHETTVTWASAARDGWAAIPAREILDPSSGIFSDIGLKSLTVAESVAFAALSRLLKNGKSMTIALPLANCDNLLHLCFYLHRLRLDAFEDSIRTPWLNHQRMAARPHLVFITRPLIRHRHFARVPDLHAIILRSSTQAKPSHPDRLATILLAADRDPAAALECIEQQTRPFVFLIDATPSGLDDGAADFITSLHTYFPEVPRIVLMALGDAVTLEKMVACESAGHLWQMRLGDVVKYRVISPAIATTKLEIGTVNDSSTNALLDDAFSKLFQLRRVCEAEGNAALLKLMGPLNKVMTGLRQLYLPLAQLDEQLTRDTKPGRFPIRSLKRWLELAGDASFRFGTTQAAHDAAKIALLTAHDHLLNATTGKEQALLSLVEAAANKKMRVGVLVGSSSEAKLLHDWFDRMLDSHINELVTIQSMDDAKSILIGPDMIEHIVVAGMLWPSRLHWLGIECRRITVLCYPFEQVSMEKQIGKWWSANGASSVDAGDKLSLWQLEWSAGRLLDQATAPDSATAIELVPLNFTGKHPKPVSIVDLDVTDRNADWLEVLLAEPDPEVDSSPLTSSDADADLVWITLDEYPNPIPWSRHRPTLVLKGDDLVSKLPAELETDDELILLINSDERVATQSSLFELFVTESTGLEQFTLIAEKWQHFVSSTFAKLKTVRAMREKLKAGGVSVLEVTVKNWINHQVIGPDDPKAIEILATYLELKSPISLAKRVNSAIVKIRTERRAIGRDLRAAILARLKGADKVRIGKLTLEVEALDSMFEICHVREICTPPLVKKSINCTLAEVAEEIQALHPDRLVFTPAASRSMRNCEYRDTEKFKQCILLMASRLHPMYLEKKDRFDDVLEAFKTHQITYAPGMADTTQGRFAVYNRLYGGVRVDIGKHFRMGTSFDPTRTIRIHYHWDEAEKQIIIHHAGEHLPTNAG